MSSQEFANDADFVFAIRSGGRNADRAADVLYRTHRKQVVSFMKHYVGYRSGQFEDVRDLTQDAFIILLNKIENGGYKDGALIHFWIGIAKGLLRNKVKRDAKTDLVDDNAYFEEVDLETPERWAIDKERSEMINTLLDELGERCKKVLTLWSQSYSMEEIAEIVGLGSEGMARKTKFKCKKKLIQLIAERDIEF